MFLRLFCCVLAVALAGLLPSVAQENVRPRVSITSQPSGASVVIDGSDRGTTPLTLFDLEPGRHHLKLRLAGYVERDRFINTDEGPFIEKNEVLQEEKGLLLLKSDPPGANIVIDGVTLGQTPRLITNLSAKDSYIIRLRKAGYQDQALSVKFNGREPKVCDAKLVLASGVLDIISEPVGAEVMVNGIARGKTPVTVKDVPRGRAVVKFSFEGFVDETRELAVNAGDRQTLSVALKGLPGTLHLISVPDGARFYVNGEARGKGPLAISGLTPGDYEVRAECEGYGTVTRTVRLENGMAAREEFRLSNVMGRLEVRTDPVGAQVFLDGRLLGVTKAVAEDAEYSDVFPIENVLEGEHTLVIRKDGHVEALRHPKIENSKTAKANIRLKRVFCPDVEIVTARGEYRGILKANTSSFVEVEVSLGITRSFPRDEIRKIIFLDKAK